MSIAFGVVFQLGHAPAAPVPPMVSIHSRSAVLDATPIVETVAAPSNRRVYHAEHFKSQRLQQQPSTQAYTPQGLPKMNAEIGLYLDVFA